VVSGLKKVSESAIVLDPNSEMNGDPYQQVGKIGLISSSSKHAGFRL